MLQRSPRTATLLFLVLAASIALASAASSKPWFCHDLDCPDFKVVEQNDDYEVREYAKGRCVEG